MPVPVPTARPPMSIRRSLAYSFLDRYASLLVNIGASMVLARLLTPHEVGAYSVTMVLVSMMTTVRDLGAGQYLVQEKELTEDRLRAAWALLLGLGVLLSLAMLAASIPAGLFYGDTRVRDIMLVLAAGYLVNPFGSMTYAWLMREMRYDATAVMRLCANLATAATSIGLAWRGWGAISLAWGSLAGTLVNALVANLYRPRGQPWLPGLREMRRVLSFGTRMTLSSIARTLSAGTPEFLLGKLQDLAAAGFYSRANGLVSMFNRLVTDAACAVAFSTFARQSREAQDSRSAFLLGTAHVTALGWSFAGALIFLAHPLVRVLYGSQWEASADLVRWLAGALAFAAPVPLCLVALGGVGEAARVLRITLLSALAALPLFLAGAAHGLDAIGAAAVVADGVGSAICLRTTCRVLGCPWGSLFAVFRRSAVVALAASAAPALVYFAHGPAPEDTLAVLLPGGAGAAVGFIAGVLLARHPLRDELRRLPGGVSLFSPRGLSK